MNEINSNQFDKYTIGTVSISLSFGECEMVMKIYENGHKEVSFQK